MGFFSRFIRKSAVSSEASTEVTRTAAPTAGPPAENAGTTARARPERAGPAVTGPAEGVEIPKQQSAEAAADNADNEAGKSTHK
jgi:hypothetical protein